MDLPSIQIDVLPSNRQNLSQPHSSRGCDKQEWVNFETLISLGSLEDLFAHKVIEFCIIQLESLGRGLNLNPVPLHRLPENMTQHRIFSMNRCLDHVTDGKWCG